MTPTAKDRARLDLQEHVEAALNTDLTADEVREAVEDQIAWTVDAAPVPQHELEQESLGVSR